MKVIYSIEMIYENQKRLNELLRTKVDEIINHLKESNWHYIGRIKTLESFALKLETGRFAEPSSMEDFFACTIVVDNLSQIKLAEQLLREQFEIVSRRPKNDEDTHKEPHSFQYDDLRLYSRLKSESFLPDSVLSRIVFEIQIKTFLQHAWSIATHDLIYKSNEISWSKERIAYQIKAMLEQAELSISTVANFSEHQQVSKENSNTKRLKKTLKFYLEHFHKDD